MRPLLSFITATVFAVQAAALPTAAVSPRELQRRTETQLRIAVAASRHVPTAREMLKVFTRPTDRAYLRKILAEKLDHPVVLKFVGPASFSVRFNGEQAVVSIKDLQTQTYSVFKRDFKFSEKEPVEKAIARLSKTLAGKTTHNLVIPDAHALAPLVAVGIYLSIGTVGWATCAQQRMNSVGVCAWAVPGWAPIAAYIAGMQISFVIEKEKIMRGETSFDLTELVCPSGAQPLKATVTDSNAKPLTIIAHVKPDGKAASAEFKTADGAAKTLKFNDDWWPADGSEPKLTEDVGISWDYHMAARGVQQILDSCKDDEAKEALARYIKKKAGTRVLAPEVDSSGVGIKVIK